MGNNTHQPHLMFLIHEISRLTHQKIKADCPDIQRSWRLIMMELARRDNVTQLDLVRATHLKPPTISVTLQKMEQDGIVSRRPDAYDLRATRVSLTEKGREMDTQIFERFREEERRMESALTPEEAETLEEILLKLKNYLTGGTEERE
ncbi:MAG: winged helix-turn-helix transcriptional regulator [Clostridia bacterium]|nr:winged helix-turn-helix transcriptional regulator [Clostridia bacterium]